jgi:tetratricopeptide (TPR) repeat protein
VNTYIRLLSVDPSHVDVQKKLIQSLDGLGDANAVMYMTQWYLQEHLYDVEIQRYLANAYFTREEYVEAEAAYARVLRDFPEDVFALEHQADALMIMKEYEKALIPLEVLHANYSRRQDYYRKIAICNAQLLKGKETAQILGRAAQLFQKVVVVGWIQDPLFDPIRTDRAFQAFTDRVAGTETRMRLEALAAGQTKKADKGPKLVVPTDEKLDAELLKPRK